MTLHHSFHLGELSVKDQVFSEYFEFSGSRASSSLEAISLLDSNKDKNIDSSDTRFSDIHLWVDADNDGKVDNGEFSQLSGNVSLATDTSVASSVSGGNATILRSADTNISYNSNTKVYEASLGIRLVIQQELHRGQVKVLYLGMGLQNHYRRLGI